MPRRSLLPTLVAMAACAPPSVMSRAPVSRPTVATGSPDTAALARDIPRLLRLTDLPGLSMAVVRKDRVIWARGFGTVNDSTRTPVDTATVFEAASLSKPVFAYIVLRLADRGEFDLDRPLVEMLEYPRIAHDERYKRITARMVLSHGTGLPNWGGDALTLSFDPGTAYAYSGEGFVFLQKALERVTGDSLDELSRREVFQPLGMTRSSYVWQNRFAGNVAYGRNWLWNIAPVNRYPEANAAASLLTTAPDYARFVAAVLAGRGLSTTMWKSYLTPVRETSPGISIGLGIRVEDGSSGLTFYHSGNNGRRFTCYMTGDIGQGLGLVYFTNASDGTALVEPLASRVLGREPPARNWATFDRHDDPRRLALRSVQRAAVEGGADAARERLQAIRADSATRPSFDDILDLGAFFTGRGLAPLSIEVLESAVAEAPDSARGHLALGRALEAAGDAQAAMTSYRRADTLEGEGNEARRQIEWTEDRIAARARTSPLSVRTLESYAGRYQEWTITLRDGRLLYNGGANPESPLIPMTENLFEVEADPMFRIRFVGDGVLPAAKLLALYSDGSIEESMRSE
jgi:CubicO group peptidase (beta-lactamase class C family)